MESDDQNSRNIIIFSETIRMQMQTHTSPLIKHRRKLLRTYPDVFVGSEAVAWATKMLKSSSSDDLKSVGSNIAPRKTSLTSDEAFDLFQKLMDAGLLQNVTSQELFKNDKSFFRFAADDADSDKLIRSVAIGYRVFNSAITSHSKLFERVCALGRLVSTECLKASQLVSFLVSSGLCSSREASIALCQNMVECYVIKPVDSDVQGFEDGKNFYLFGIDFRKPTLSVEQFLSSNILPTCPVPQPQELPLEQTSNSHRNKLIHLRQTSDQLMDFSYLSLRGSSATTETRNDRLEYNGSSSPSASTYKSLLNKDGSFSKEALFHPSSPFVRKDLTVYPDAVGYGFVIRGDGPSYVKIVDPDSPAGKAGLKAHQYITSVNGNDVTEMPHARIADLILNGPRVLKITIMQDKSTAQVTTKSAAKQSSSSMGPSPVKKKSPPSLPSAQPWIKNRSTNAYNTGRYQLVSR